MTFLLPRRITAQIALLLVLCVFLFHAAVFVILFSFGTRPPPHAADGALSAIVALNAIPAAERNAVISAFSTSFPELRLAPAGSEAARPAQSPIAEMLRSKLPARIHIDETQSGTDGALLATLTDGQKISLETNRRPGGPSGIILVTILFVAASVLIFSLWAAFSLTLPLRRFAAAAEAFTFNSEPAPLDESGPTEVRLAAQAFNRMQVRISQLASQQARTLAAVSHDLRTPITRMRLHAEFLGDADTKSKILRDLEQMDAMVHACLIYLRGGARREFSIIDLESLLQTLADQFAEIDAPVQFTGTDGRLAISGDPDDLARAFGNLIDNAIKFGGSAEIVLTQESDFAIVEVSDRGPGIPAAKRSVMFEPFERGDESRRKDGFGLGLAIARAIVDNHHGALELRDRSEGGLTVRVRLHIVTVPSQTARKPATETL